jgi:hypothetical protein
MRWNESRLSTGQSCEMVERRFDALRMPYCYNECHAAGRGLFCLFFDMVYLAFSLHKTVI